MSRLIKMKLEVAFILCLAASTMVACVPVRRAVFQTPVAQALEPSGRAVMEQPDWQLFSLDHAVKLEDADCRSNEKWYKVLLGFREPARIEVAPGKHRFYFHAGHTWNDCYFQLTMLPGHVYKPTWFSRHDVCNDCRRCACLLEVIDTAPDGNRSTHTVRCCGYPYQDCE